MCDQTTATLVEKQVESNEKKSRIFTTINDIINNPVMKSAFRQHCMKER